MSGGVESLTAPNTFGVGCCPATASDAVGASPMSGKAVSDGGAGEGVVGGAGGEGVFKGVGEDDGGRSGGSGEGAGGNGLGEDVGEDGGGRNDGSGESNGLGEESVASDPSKNKCEDPAALVLSEVCVV